MSNTKNPHLVPQFYLRNFASRKTAQLAKNQQRIYTYSKRQNQEIFDVGTSSVDPPRPPLIKSVATYEEFYEPYGEGDVIEGEFNRLESMGKRAIDEITHKRSVNTLSTKQRSRLSEYLATQYFRTLKNRRFIEPELKLMIDTVLTDPTSDGSKIIFAQWEEADKRRFHLSDDALARQREAASALPPLEKDEALAEIDTEAQEREKLKAFMKHSLEQMRDPNHEVEGRKWMRERFQDTRLMQNTEIQHMNAALKNIVERSAWVLGINTSPIPFITSDNPLVVYPLEKLDDTSRRIDRHSFLCELGLVDFTEHPKEYPPYELHFPLNPRLILIIRAFYSGRVDDPILIGEAGPLDINHYQALQSHDQVFSITNRHLETQVGLAIDAERVYRDRANLQAGD